MDPALTPELNQESLTRWLQDQGALGPTAGQWQQLEALRQHLAAANQAHNLTRLVDPEDFLLRHVVDSLLVTAVWPVPLTQAVRVADVGCGAGFPGLPLEMLVPAAQFTEIDSTQKKILFVAEAVRQLGLSNVHPNAGRARELGRQPAHLGRYQLVLARAVAATWELIPECRRLLEPATGVMICFKTPQQMADEEILTQREAAKARLHLSRSPLFRLPGGVGDRQFWILQRASGSP
jgi:16S rRNA (guanine527-N7)-methyltransferase